MKVLIQDAKTKRYFSASGRWVAAETDARDFTSLILAYNYAKRFTARRFTIVLFCPDDDYRASIIEGDGVAEDGKGTAVSVASAAKTSKHKVAVKKASHSSVWARFNACMTSTRNCLN